MKKIAFLFLSVVLPIILFGQKTKLKQVKYYKSDVIKEEYYVLKKNSYIKHGVFRSYYDNGIIKESGEFSMNKRNGEWKEYGTDGKVKRIIRYNNGQKTDDRKVGVWLEYFENGQVIKGFDYDKNEKIETKINVSVYYPAIARENQIEGIVNIKIKLSSTCETEELSILEGIGFGCDEEAIRSVKRFIDLIKKYTPEKCEEINTIMPIHFKLK
ncbi:MAG: energy transducer TonB [Saprospiraceae bacterium]